MNTIILQGENGSYSFTPSDPLSCIGLGGTGRIFKGTEMNTGTTVAIKVLHRHLTQDPANIERLRIESQISVEHENLVKMLDFIYDKSSDIYHSISEFIEGITLSKRIEQLSAEGQVLSTSEVKKIGISVVNALEVLHNNRPQIIHRDVDPTNIMIGNNGIVKLLDLGIAKVIDPLNSRPALTSLGSIIGKLYYISPEQIHNAAGGVITPASDIYSLGITLYECLTGDVPFSGSSEFEIYKKHQTQKLPQDPRFNTCIYRFLLNSTAKLQIHRYSNADAFRKDLCKINDDGTCSGNIKLIFDPYKWYKYVAAAFMLIALTFTGYGMLSNLQHKHEVKLYCGDNIKTISLSPKPIPVSVGNRIDSFVASVDMAASETLKWKNWFNNPVAFDGKFNTSGILLPKSVLAQNENRLLIKLLLELKDPSLGSYADKTALINNIPWNQSKIVFEALQGDLRTNMFVQLNDNENTNRRKLGAYYKQIEQMLFDSHNYKMLYELAAKSEYNLKAARYAILNNQLDYAEKVIAKALMLNQQSFESKLLLGNLYACQDKYDEAYNKYTDAFTELNKDSTNRELFRINLKDLEQLTKRKDIKSNPDFLRFALGLHYYYGANMNSRFLERSDSLFRCFIASADGVPQMKSFIKFANRTNIKHS